MREPSRSFSCIDLTCRQHLSQLAPSQHGFPPCGCEPICEIVNSFPCRLQLSALRYCLKIRILLIVPTDRQLASFPAPSCRNDLQICASIASFSLTSPSSESSNPFASWMVDVVDDSCRDCIRPRQPSISIASTLPRHDDVSTTTSFPVHQTRCVPSRSARSPPVMSSGRQRTPCQESIVVLLMPLELRHRTRYTRRALSQLAPAMDGVFTNI